MKLLRKPAPSLLLLNLLLITPSVEAQQPKVDVGPNVQASVANAEKRHGEVLVAADPTNPSRLIGCSMISSDPLSRQVWDGVTYVSQDRGAHWVPTLYESGAWDPACGFGPDGKAYAVYLVPGLKGDDNRVSVYRSDDAGKTWLPPAHIDSIDREYITVDTTGGGYHGRVYINGTGFARQMDPPSGNDDRGFYANGISIQRSLDGGVSFKPPLQFFSIRPHWVLGMGNGVVLSDGTYIAVFGEQRDRNNLGEKRPAKANARLKTISSSDGGASFSNATIISDWYMSYGHSTSSNVPTLAADRSSGPFRDRLYAVWPDYRSGRGEILLSYSSDKGKTWSKPREINDDRAWAAPTQGPDDVMPVVDVNRNGVVGVMWYDRRDNPNNYGWWVRFSASTDGGHTFSPSVRVSEAPAFIKLGEQFELDGSSNGGGNLTSWQKGGNLQMNIGFGTFFTFNGGHTAGMTADAGGIFHPFWIDNRTGVEQIWTAAVSVDGSAMRNGSKELAGLEDVTEKVTLDLKNGKFDRTTGTLSIDAYLENTSDQKLMAPLKIRVLSLDSKMGLSEIQNGDNREPGAGAVWDFSREIPDEHAGLAPGGRTKLRPLTFRLYNFEWGGNPPAPEDLRKFISIEAVVLASKAVPEK
jgi:hypothetical protein